MTVAFDAFASNTSGGTGTIAWTHTPVGLPRGILVMVDNVGSADDVASVIYGATAMTEVPLSPFTIVTGSELNGNRLHCFFLGSSLPGGSGVPVTITVNSNGQTLGKRGYSVSVTAGGDTEVNDTGTDSGTAANPSVLLTLSGITSYAQLLWRSGQDAVGSVSPLTNWTDRSETDLGATTTGFYTFNTIGTSNVTAGISQASEQFGLFGVSINEIFIPAPPFMNSYRQRRG